MPIYRHRARLSNREKEATTSFELRSTALGPPGIGSETKTYNKSGC